MNQARSGAAAPVTGRFLLTAVLLTLFFHAPNTLFAYLGFEYFPYFLAVFLLLFALVAGKPGLRKNRLGFNPPFVLALCFSTGAMLFLAGALTRLGIGYQVFPGWIAGAFLYIGCIPLVLSVRGCDESVKNVVSILVPVLFIQFVLQAAAQALFIFPTFTLWEEAGRWYSPLLGQLGSPDPNLPPGPDVARFHSWFSESNNFAFYIVCLTIAEIVMWRRKHIVAMGLLTLIGTFSLHAIISFLLGALFIRRSRPIIIILLLLMGSTLLLPEVQFVRFGRVGTFDYLYETQTETIARVIDLMELVGVRELVVQETLFGLDPLYSMASVGVFGIGFLVLAYVSLLYSTANRYLAPFVPLLIVASAKQVPLIFTPTLFALLVMTSLAFGARDARKMQNLRAGPSPSPAPGPAGSSASPLPVPQSG